MTWLGTAVRIQEWLQNPEKSPPEVFGIWGELTARIYANQRRNRANEDRLKANVEYLQDSFASMRDAVVMVEANGSIKWFNSAAKALLGLRYATTKSHLHHARRHLRLRFPEDA